MRIHARQLAATSLLLGMLSLPGLVLAQGELDPSTMTEDQIEEAFQENLERANDLYGEKKFEEALLYFNRAYKVRAEPKLLFNMGIICERLGRLEEAVGYYDRFITSPDVSLELRGQGQKRLDVLRPIVKSQREEREREERARRVAQGIEEPDEDDDGQVVTKRPGKKRPAQSSTSGGRVASYVVGGTGLVLAAVGGGMLLTLEDPMAFADEPTPDARRSARDSRATQQGAGTWLLAGGGALLVTGLVMWALTGEESPPPAQSTTWRLAPLVGPQGAALGVFGSF